MKHLFAFTLLFCLGIFTAMAQEGEISGTVKDGTTGEPLGFANIVYGAGKGVVADLDGNFTLKVPYGTYTLKITFSDLLPQEKTVVVDRKQVPLGNISLSAKELDVVTITADYARDRETPVAFANVLPAQVEEELGSQDLPMLLNSTPGVYATNQGGGDGDVRINIRGFNQRNVAVLLDGVPVNDMENGWVYWSNWFGLDAVMRSTQVQRGLSASKIALPSVGGTMNILTKGIDAKKGASVKQEITSYGYKRLTLGLTTGRTKSGWGVTFAGSRKWGNNWVDGTYTNGMFYFLKVEKKVGNHLLSLSGFGAPQEHGQRSFKAPIPQYDKEYAAKLFKGSSEEYANMKRYKDLYDYAQRFPNNPDIQDSLTTFGGTVGLDPTSYAEQRSEKDFIDTTGFRGHIRYNPSWGHLERFSIDNPQYVGASTAVMGGDTVAAKREVFNERLNYYHKPQFSLRDFWTVNDKLYIATTAYLSVGSGGGTAITPSIGDFLPDGQIDVQGLYNANRFGDTYSEEHQGRQSASIVRSSINNHFWYGALSTLTYRPTKYLSMSGGLDVRAYKGIHYREVYDLLGGDFFIQEANNGNRNQTSNVKRVGDKINYHNDALVRWGGGFGQVEYNGGNWTGFANVSASISSNKRVDHFRNRDLVIDGEVYNQIVGAEQVAYFNGTDFMVVTSDADVTVIGDTTYAGNQQIANVTGTYTNQSAEARTAQTDWLSFPSYTVKLGANYKFNEHHNAFMNVGYLSRSPRFANVINQNNDAIAGARNELVQALELGYSLRKKRFAGNVNAYYTAWQNKPLDRAITARHPETDDLIFANVNNINAVHTGVELDFAYKMSKQWQFDGIASLGDWRWASGDTARFITDDGQIAVDPDGEEMVVVFDAQGVPVGDAAQTQLAAALRWSPVKAVYVKVRATRFDRNFAAFNPIDYDPRDLHDDIEGRQAAFYENGDPVEPWRLPAYTTFDVHAGYSFKVNETRVAFRLSAFNALNTVYISDAQNNDGFNGIGTANTFDASSAGVFFGQGRRLSTSLKISF